MNPFERFDKIYCINLDHRRDRWEQSLAEFQKLGLQNKVERFSAVKYSQFDKATGKERIKYGAWGCRDSHVKCVEKAKQEGFENVLIFEDDIKTISLDTQRLNKAIDQCFEKEDWILFYLGGNHIQDAIRLSPELLKINGATTTHAYAFNIKHYEEIEKSMKECEYIDMFYLDQIPKHLGIYHSDPIYFTQRTSFSDIRSGNRSYKIESNFNAAIRELDK
jgi:GR25 family glycosyltransferase involved in LPS biosynthesis